MPKKLLRKTVMFFLVNLVFLIFLCNKQSFCMNEEEEKKTSPLQGGHNLLSTISSLRSNNLKNEEEIKKLLKKNQELEKIEKEKTELVLINSSLQQALLEKKKEVDALNKKNEMFKKFEEKVTKETDNLRREKEELYVHNVSLKKKKLKKEKEIEVLIEERNKLYLLTKESNETHDTIQKMMAIIGLNTDDLINCTGNLFAKKCLDRLNTEARSNFGEQSLTIQDNLSDSHLMASVRTSPELSVEIKAYTSSQAPIAQASVFKPIPEIFNFDRWQKGLLSIHEPWANLIWETWSSQNLTALDLHGTSYYSNSIPIGNAGAIVIATLLAINSSLTSLNLSNNQIGVAGGVAIGEALKTNFSLTSLSLYNNQIAAEKGRALPNLLAIPSLTYLNLMSNEIYAFEAEVIARSLLTNSSLKTLNLWGNSIGRSGLTALLNVRQLKPRMQINF